MNSFCNAACYIVGLDIYDIMQMNFSASYARHKAWNGFVHDNPVSSSPYHAIIDLICSNGTLAFGVEPQESGHGSYLILLSMNWELS